MLTSIRNGLIAGLIGLLLIGIGLKAADLGNSIYSETDASNNASSLFPEGMAPSAVNDNLRGFIGAVYRWYNHSQATTASTGSGGAFILTYAVTPAAYATGDVYRYRANFTVTGTSTVNVNGLGVRAISKGIGTTPLEADDIRSGQIVELSYDPNTGTFQLQSPAGGGTFAQGMPTNGSSNAYTIGLSPAPTQYFTGMGFRFRASFSNTSSASINVNGLGFRTITKGAGATALQADDIRSGQVVELSYDPNTGTFQMVSPIGGGLNESGSWTPTIRGTSTAGTQTYSVQTGRYTRVGDLVYAEFRCSLTAKDATTAGSLQIAGLPFTSNSAGGYGTFTPSNIVNWSYSASGAHMIGAVGASSVIVDLLFEESDGDTASVDPAHLKLNSTLQGTIIYRSN